MPAEDQIEGPAPERQATPEASRATVLVDRVLWRFGFLGWSGIRSYGESRVVRSSPVWLVVVPASVKAIEALRDHETLGVLAELSLPFSWYLVFFGALAFAAGGWVYTASCPRIIRDGRTYNDFTSSGRSLAWICAYAHEIGVGDDGGTSWLADYRVQLAQGMHAVVRSSGTEVQAEDLGEATRAMYWRLRVLADCYNPRRFRWAATFYCAGIVCFGTILLWNVAWVICHLLGVL